MAGDALLRELQDIFNKWKDGYSNRSIAELARRSGISYADARRTIQGEIKPSFANIAPLLKVMLSTPESALFYEKHFPSEYEVLKNIILDHSKDPASSVNVKIIDDGFLKLLLDPYYFPIIAFVSSFRKKSIDREVIRIHYGINGIAILNQLIAKGVVKEASTGVITFPNWYQSKNHRVILMIISEGARYMASNPKTYGYFSFARVNETALRKMFQLVKNYERELEEIINKDTSVGDISINCSTIMGRIGFSAEE